MKGVFSLGFCGSSFYRPPLPVQQLYCHSAVRERERKKKLLLCWLRAVQPAHSSCGPGLENLFLIAACPCDLVSVCLPASVNSKKRHQCLSERRGRQLNLTHERAHSATVNQPAIWSGDQPSVAWEIHT